MKIPKYRMGQLITNNKIIITYIDEDDNNILIEHPNGLLVWGHNYWGDRWRDENIINGINWEYKWHNVL